MACAHCTPLLEADTNRRERSELETFEILEETKDKYDAATLWLRGRARCRLCQQSFDFEYLTTTQGFGRLTPVNKPGEGSS